MRGHPRSTLFPYTTLFRSVLFRIYEGEPVRLTKLTLVGLDSILDVAGVKRTLPLQEGAPFNRLLFQASADTIADRLRNAGRSEEHTSELQSHSDLVCRLLL